MDTKKQICDLKKEKDTLILAHYYVDGDVQDVADFVGDSYALAKKAAATEQKNILFCGVRFMGESAKLLNPDKHVYMGAAGADCPMAHMVTPEQIAAVREQYPDAAVVCYVNSTAEVKACSDVCVTSSNAIRVTGKLPQKQIFFIPDSHLAHFVAKALPEKEFIYHDGYCPTHQKIDRESLLQAKKDFPEAEVLAHPECADEILELSDFVGSTAEIIRYAREHETEEYIIATETGVFYQMEKENPGKKFYPVTNCQVCPNMKKNSLKKVEQILLHMEDEEEVLLDDALMERARIPLERMLELAD